MLRAGRALGQRAWLARCSASSAASGEASTSGREHNGGGGSSGRSSALPWLALSAAAGAVALGTGYARQEQAAWRGDNAAAGPSSAACTGVLWVQQLAARPGNEVVLSARTMHQHPLLKRDHMFSELHRHEMVEDLVCFFSAADRRLSYVIQLGKNVSGFPGIQHGGMTAAIVDESFGFLWLSLRAAQQLPFRGPAFTAHLEVDYKAKIPAGRLLLCTTEVESCEGRKLWMRATVQDGPSGKVYATARALFVCPKTHRLIHEGVKYVWSSVFA